MVIAGIGALASLGLALPTGLAFGYGYGYGVRQGYHAFRPSKSSVTRDLHLSPNPVKGAHGAGLLSAEEMTSRQSEKVQPPLNVPPPPQQTARTISDSMSPKPIKRAKTGHKYESNEERYTGRKDYWHRYEAGAIVDSIPKDLARSIWRKHNMKGDDRAIRTAYIKRRYPFNSTTPSRR